jgi:hypothetical protein
MSRTRSGTGRKAVTSSTSEASVRPAQPAGEAVPDEVEVDDVVTLRLMIDDKLVLTVRDPAVIARMLAAERERRQQQREA